MKKYFLFLIVVFPLGVILCQTPHTITFQGILTDVSGKIKPDGKYYLNASLYPTSGGGTPVWSENNLFANVSGGVFNIILGQMANLPDFDEEYWLEIQLIGEQPMQRIKIHSTPYAIFSEKSRISLQSLVSGFSDSTALALSAKYSDSTGKAYKAKYSDTSAYSKKAKLADSSASSYRALTADSTLKSFRAKYADSALYASYGVMPVGSIVAFAGRKEKIPFNWMLCNGAALSSTKYSELYGVIDSVWGNGSDDAYDSTDFNLPDLQGMFIRGVDDSTGRDPDAFARQSLKEGGNCGDIVGSVQSHAVVSAGFNESSLSAGSSFCVNPVMVPKTEYSNIVYSNSFGNETRPVNVSVYFIIKVK